MIQSVWTLCRPVVMGGLLIGCARISATPPPPLPGGYLLPAQQPPSQVVSRRIVLVADNQLHNLYGGPVPFLRSELANRLVQPAIRPVQLDFYGQDLLRWVVEEQGRFSPIVHIGDACDFACTGEFRKFREIMRQAKHGWVMAPGNHDGFFFGNEHRDATNDDWRQADQAVADRAVLRAVSWRIDAEHPWRSFIVQEVDLCTAAVGRANRSILRGPQVVWRVTMVRPRGGGNLSPGSNYQLPGAIPAVVSRTGACAADMYKPPATPWARRRACPPIVARPANLLW